MMTKRENGYAIYKFRKPQSEELVTEFFTPDKGLGDKFSRNTRIAQLTADGYVCCGFVIVDRVTYLNARLNETVKEFCDNEHFRQTFKDSYSNKRLDEVFYDTMRLIDDFKWTCLQKLDQQVRRLLREDLDVQNEIALQLYDALHGRNSVVML